MWIELSDGHYLNLSTTKSIKIDIADGHHAVFAEQQNGEWKILAKYVSEKDARLAFKRLTDAIRENRPTFRL